MMKENVIIKQECHSRMPLSGIYNACRCHNEKKALLNRCVEDPRLQTSGMTPLWMSGQGLTYREEALNKNSFRAPLRSGFTLIELLVVVLIIGILAAVALPQYQKAVRKSRAVQVKTLLRSIHRAQRLCNLERGTTNSTECALLSNLDIDIPFSCTESTQYNYTQCTIGPCAWNNTCTLVVESSRLYVNDILSNGTGAVAVMLLPNSDSFTFLGGGTPGFNFNDYTGPYKD